LLSGPDCRRVVRDVDVEEFAALAEHHEDEQEAKGQVGTEKEVDGDDVRACGEKDPPRGRGSAKSGACTWRRSLGDRVAEQGESLMRRRPRWDSREPCAG
jgi:hypothetical protein